MAKSKTFKIAAIAVSIICVLCTAPLYLDMLITSSLNFIAPRTKQFDTQKPQLLYEFPDGVYEIIWSDDASHIVLKISNWRSSNPDAPDKIAEFNFKTDEVVFKAEIRMSRRP